MSRPHRFRGRIVRTRAADTAPTADRQCVSCPFDALPDSIHCWRCESLQETTPDAENAEGRRSSTTPEEGADAQER